MIAATLLALTLQAGVPAAPPVTPPVTAPVTAPASDIVVTGRAGDPAAASRKMADRVTPRLDDLESMARFDDPVCFGTMGLTRDMGATLIGRMADDATTLGVKVADAGKACTPNVLVLFVDDSKAEVERLIRRRPGLFGTMDLAEVRAVAREPGPAHAWTTSEIRSRDGDRLQPGQGGGPPVMKVSTAGMIRLPVRRDMIASVVMIDRTAVLGRSLDQLAAYALVRAVTLARVRPDMGVPTILSLFDAGATPPAGLTGFDRGYVRGFYEGMATDRPSQRLATIRREVAREALAPTGE